ncbi:MAG TPA: hypothetical protein DCQ06_08705 [Myxococcales bacterium]|nr:hypothetical protein [Myxococcales bacterium]HAN31661.1 hypothetical protein [Myxococcales bacterium]
MISVDLIAFAFVRLLLAAIFLLIARQLFSWLTPYRLRHEIAEVDNPAFAVLYGGYILAIVFALAGALFGPTGQWSDDLVGISTGAVAALLLTPLSMWLCDRVMLRSFVVQQEICRDQNVGVAYVVGGAAVATGLMLQGVLTGQSDGLWLMARDIVVYWACGQVLLLAAGWLFDLVTPFDLHERIEHDDNAAIGLAFGGFLVAEGLIVRAALQGAGSDLFNELAITAAIATMGLFVLLGLAGILSRVFLPSVAITDELVRDRNVGVGAVVAIAFVAAAILTNAAVHQHEATPVADITETHNEPDSSEFVDHPFDASALPQGATAATRGGH